MKNHFINSWIELKKQTHHFETIVRCKKQLRKTTVWDDMFSFFKEADKYIK